MIQWEYRTRKIDVILGSSIEPGDTKELTMLLELGEEGWELINVLKFTPLGLFYYFKRPLKQQTNENTNP